MIQNEKETTGKNHSISSLLNGFGVEISPCKNGLCVSVEGVEKIMAFSSEEIELLSVRGIMNISGRTLSLTVFENHSAQVRGQVEEVRFL